MENKIAVITLSYKDKEYIVHEELNPGMDDEQELKYELEEGHYSCDCVRSIMIKQEYGHDTIPLLRCGNEIKLISCYIED